ncbi:glucosamine 6-phosphate N-acetyltransferase [Russula earlei]|uniref:Glucosamine 6-phosphate N-acetyltransferase n=1 Tax=Russula earlei TaxID=71964 RepID=A0ACC0ULN6_9AGAM|nr:glucosamine 6-phosphate N-acetyltransferase [Russula earlei]
MSFTPDDALDLLFPAELIPQHVKDELPPDLHIRPLASTDYERGHLSVLSVLTQAPDVGAQAWAAQFNSMRGGGAGGVPATYYILVVVSRETDRIVGTGGVFIERKFLRGLGSVGHIEDIAVAREMQGKKLGLRIIQALTHVSEGVGCYKTILNCSEANIAFYEKCGYEKREVEMAKYAIGRAHTPRL